MLLCLLWLCSLSTLQNQIQVRIHDTAEIRRHECRGTVFANDSRTFNNVAAAEAGTIVDGGLHALAADPDVPVIDRLRTASRFRRFRK